MDVEKIANLARIKLSNEEKERFSKEFEKIVNWVSELKNVDTTNVDPFFPCYDSKLRQDIPLDFENVKGIISNFPDKEFDFVKVKKVID